MAVQMQSKARENTPGGRQDKLKKREASDEGKETQPRARGCRGSALPTSPLPQVIYAPTQCSVVLVCETISATSRGCGVPGELRPRARVA